ncbi:MAG: Gfo/Idh/MocA family oxidoreductase [Candidatus Omnitrophica bacterium]|nr:Gfo/Idh/MocA family oxidoreductase [Candidatus Omnitrophota bacterium]
MNTLKVAVIGVGHLGKEHGRIYRELSDIELIGVCDVDPARSIRAEGLKVPFFKNFQDLIPLVDAVSIATPTIAHYEVAKEFLKAGKHALVEKPITLKLEEADELMDLARKHHSVLQVGHIERHNPGLRRIREIAKNIRFMEIHRLGPFSGRINDCGVVLDLMIHDLDIVSDLVASEVENFDAVGIPVITPFEDIANVRVKFKNGAIADLTASRLTPERQRKIRIFQEDAYLSLDYEAQAAKIFRKENGKIFQETVDITKSEPLKEELNYFIRSIQNGSGLGRPDEAARNALKFAIEIVQTIQENNALSQNLPRSL